MRKMMVAGNWKMNLSLDEGISLVQEVLKAIPQLSEREQVLFCPPHLYLTTVAELIKDKQHIFAAAQNSHSEEAGAFTGEVSAKMIASAKIPWVILGHSERRMYQKETAAELAKKVDAALAAGLKVIFCCGEPLEVRDANRQEGYVQKQLQESLLHLSAAQLENVVIAYEPIWAIGTGRTAETAQAQEMHASIRELIRENFGEALAENISILYGGSCKASNAAALFACPDIDGGLIGGASLKAADFVPIIEAMVASK